MKILVTGNEGIISSVVEKVLCADAYEVIGFDIASALQMATTKQINFSFNIPQMQASSLEPQW